MMLWFFASPVIYSYLTISPSIQRYLNFNPMTHILVGYHQTMFTGEMGHWPWLLVMAPASLITFFVGYYFFDKLRENVRGRSMSSWATAIQVSNLTKVYQRYSHRKQFRTLKSALLGGSLLSDLRPDERFPALKRRHLQRARGLDVRHHRAGTARGRARS